MCKDRRLVPGNNVSGLHRHREIHRITSNLLLGQYNTRILRYKPDSSPFSCLSRSVGKIGELETRAPVTPLNP